MVDIEPIKYKIIEELKETFHFFDRGSYNGTEFLPTNSLIQNTNTDRATYPFKFVKTGKVKFLKIIPFAIIFYCAHFYQEPESKDTKYLNLIVAIIITLISLYFLLKRQAYIKVDDHSIIIDDNEFLWGNITKTFILESRFSAQGGTYKKRHLLIFFTNNKFNISSLYEFQMNASQFKTEVATSIEHFKKKVA